MEENAVQIETEVSPAELAARLADQHVADIAETLNELSPDTAAATLALLPRERAVEVFSDLRVWDTELNNGVLVYVLYADHAVEIVADRAATRAIPEPEWQAVCEAMSRAFRERAFERGCIEAVDRLNALLEREFPPGSAPRGELPDRPTLI